MLWVMQGCVFFFLKLLDVFYTYLGDHGRKREGGRMVFIAGLCQRVEWSGIEEVPGPVCEDALLEGWILHISSAFKARNGMSRRGV